MTSPTVAHRREALADLLRIGTQMSNVCFNAAQGIKIGPQLCDELRRKWDIGRAEVERA